MSEVKQKKGAKWGSRLRKLPFATFITTLCTLPTDVQAQSETKSAVKDAVFDSELLMGNGFPGDLERFNLPNAVVPGRYLVDIIVNGRFYGREEINFAEYKNQEVIPCLDIEFLLKIGVKEQVLNAPSTADLATKADNQAKVDHPDRACIPISQRVSKASTSFTVGQLQLNVWIPQAYLAHQPPSSYNIGALDAGESMLFANYDASYFSSAISSGRSSSGYLGLDSGINLGLWRLRHQSNYSYSASAAVSQSSWRGVRTYVARALPRWGSELLIGETYTSGTLFSGLSFRGIQLSTDDRMKSEFQSGYAPIVRGVANSNAKVVIRQNNVVLYQTTVSPGPFEIKDLHATYYQGALEVEVTEANGEVFHYSVPYAALVESMREGSSRYSVTLGQVQSVQDVNSYFSDLTYQYGINNLITVRSGLRVAQQYYSILGGTVFHTRLGAFGTTAYFSSADLGQENLQTGWRAGVNYNRTFQTIGTSFSLASYYHSTAGYRDLNDVLGVRSSIVQTGRDNWQSNTYRQRDEWILNVNQTLGNYGVLSVSSSYIRYYGSKNDDRQLQLAYSSAYKTLSYSLSWSRQKRGALVGSSIVDLGRASNQLMLMLTLPLGRTLSSPTLSATGSWASDNRNVYQTTLNGFLDVGTSYGISVGHDGYTSDNMLNAQLQKQFSISSIGANYAKGAGFTQWGSSARGSIVAHRGGVTLGPYLSDTFALIEAKGAQGATIRNTPDITIDRFGYAIVPSLTPYRTNQVGLASKGMPWHTELRTSQRNVTPYAGASVKLTFEVLQGYAVLIRARLPDGRLLPAGVSVVDEEGVALGMAGQASQVYARVTRKAGQLKIQLNSREACILPYDLSGQPERLYLYRLETVCEPVDAVAKTAQEQAI